MLAKKRNRMAAVPPVPADDDGPPDLAALEAEWDASLAAAEKGQSWNGRDPKVIERELYAAQDAAEVASELNTGPEGHITRREFEQFKTAVAVWIVGVEAVLKDPTVSPRRVLYHVYANFAAMGFSKAQAKELAEFDRRANVVEKQYGNWDRATKSQREYALRDAALRRPRFG